MSVLGPGIAPSPIPQTGAPVGARAAQAAFFRAAMGAAEIQPVAPIASARPEPRAAQADEARPTRPGALLDIRV